MAYCLNKVDWKELGGICLGNEQIVQVIDWKWYIAAQQMEVVDEWHTPYGKPGGHQSWNIK